MNKEEIYDSKINPLMAEILHLCQEHKIAMVADFALGGDLHCTSAMLEDEYEPSKSQIMALDLLKPQRSEAITEMVTTELSGRTKIILRSVS